MLARLRDLSRCTWAPATSVPNRQTYRCPEDSHRRARGAALCQPSFTRLSSNLLQKPQVGSCLGDWGFASVPCGGTCGPRQLSFRLCCLWFGTSAEPHLPREPELSHGTLGVRKGHSLALLHACPAPQTADVILRPQDNTSSSGKPSYSSSHNVPEESQI